MAAGLGIGGIWRGMGVWENRQGSGVGSCNLPRATDQAGPDLSPPRMAGGLRAGGPGRGKGDHQLHPKEVTQGQKAEAAGQGPIRCTGGEQRADDADRQKSSETDGWPAGQTGREAQADRQLRGCQSTQEEAGRPSDPEPVSHLAETPAGPPEAASAVGAPAACAGWGGRGGCGEPLPQAPPTERPAPPPREGERGGRGPGPRGLGPLLPKGRLLARHLGPPG